jgi:hypothetical protein
LVKTVENNLSEDSDQYDCSDEDDYFEGSKKRIVKIGKVKAVSRQSDWVSQMSHLVLSASFINPEVLLYSTMAVNLFFPL